MNKTPKSIVNKLSPPDTIKDLTGKRFGKWVVLGYAGRKDYRSAGSKLLWLCRCECGVEKNIFQGNLTHKMSTQCQRCASIRNKLSPTDPSKDLTGKRFGKWLVLKYAGEKGCKHMWLSRCECGVEKMVSQSNLLNKLSTQCQRCAWTSLRIPDKKLYRVWKVMCDILPKVWQDFDAFRMAVGEPPDDTARLARYKIAKPHGPGNTYWVTHNDSSAQEQRKIRHEQEVLESKLLMKVRSAKTKGEKKRCVIAAREAGYTFELIGIAAGVSRQYVHQILTNSSK